MVYSGTHEDLNKFSQEIETRLWDIITEFHFHLNDLSKWRDWGIVEKERVAKLRLKLKHIVLDIMLDHALRMDAREQFVEAMPSKLVDKIKAMIKEE